MRCVYADNGATSFPKPREVGESICRFLDNIGGNVGRGSYSKAYEAGSVVYETRQLLCELFNYHDPLHAVFTANVTESINTIVKGLLRKGDHVIISSMEHNAVMRPLTHLEKKGVEYTKVLCGRDGSLKAEDIEKSIKPNTTLVILTHASNVCGTVLPIEEVGEICRTHNIFFAVDSAQSAGVLKLDMKKMNINALTFTGHKGLLGPQGIGGFILDDSILKRVEPLKEGGTGSYSQQLLQPEAMPDRFESGTLNIPGIFGLNAALKYLQRVGVENIYAYEMELSERFLQGVLNMDGVSLSGIKGTLGRTCVFSLDFQGADNSEAAFLLDREFGVMTRVGLHCAPCAHETLGTYPKGTVRFSFGHLNTLEEIDYVIESIYKTIGRLR